MSAVRGIDGLTYREVAGAIGRGGRFVVYPYCISALIVTFRQASPVFFVRPGAGTFRQRLPYLLISACFGWWGFPFGLIFTPIALIQTLGGGRDVTADMVAAILAEQPQLAPAFSTSPPATPDPPSWKAAYWQGKDALDGGDLVRAEALFRTACDRAPAEPHPRYYVARIMMQIGRYREAAAAFEYLNSVVPAFGFTETHIMVCDLAAARTLPPEAVRLILALQADGTSDEALAQSKQLTAMAPAIGLGPYYFAKAIARRAPLAAISAYEQCLTLRIDATTAIDALTALSSIAQQRGDRATAQRILRDMVRQYAGHPRIETAARLIGEPVTA